MEATSRFLKGDDSTKRYGGLSFKDFELFNFEMLARQAWHLSQNPDSLSARMLKNIYYANDSVLNASLGSDPSKIWRAIVEGRDTLRKGLIKRIGNSLTTRI